MRIGKRRVLAMVIISLGFAGCAPEVPPTIETIQSTAQRLDSSNSWNLAGTMTSARQGHAALKLSLPGQVLDGHVLVVGGTADPSKAAELYDPTADKWEPLAAPGSTVISTQSDCRPALAQINKSAVLVVSTDWNNNTSTVSTFIPATSQWTPIYDLPNVTCSPTIIPLAMDQALILADDAANAQILPFLYTHGDAVPVKSTTALPAPKEGTWIGSASIRLDDKRVLVTGGAGINGDLVRNGESIVFDATEPPTWTFVGEMLIRRANHALALLPNGNVLAVGGYTLGPYPGQWSETAEVFDKQTMLWGAVSPMANARVRGATATFLDIGLVLVIGGSISSTAEIFDPSINEWTQVEGLDDARYYNHATTLLDSGQALVTGGAFSGESNHAALCNALAFAWESIESIPGEDRAFHSATAMDKKTLLVVGGVAEDANGNLQSLQDAWLYDVVNNQWSAANSPSFARGFHTATQLLDGRVLVAGGMDESAVISEFYDFSTKTWEQSASLPVAIMRASATLLNSPDDGRVLHVGGIYSGSANQAAHEVLLYDVESKQWKSAPDLPEDSQRFGHSATLLNDGTVLVIGGFTSCPVSGTDATAVATGARYHPATNTWSAIASMKQARAFHSATLIAGGRVLVAGGGGEIANDCVQPTWQSVHTTTEVYDPDTNTWTSAGSLNEARTEHQAVLLEGGNVIIGGGRRTTTRILASAEIFDTNSRLWSATSRLQRARYGHSFTQLDRGVVAVGGIYSFSLGQSTTERFPQAQQGSRCTLHEQCNSNHCIDGVCCDEPCNSECKACSARSPKIKTSKKLGDGFCEDVSGCSQYACQADTGTCGNSCTDINGCATGYVCDLSGICIEALKNTSTIDESGCTAAHLDSNTSPWASLALVASAYALRRRKHQRKS